MLAVIIILSILVALSVPKFRNIINSSKNSVRESDIKMFLKALGNEIYAKKVKDNFNPQICEVNDGLVTCDGDILDMEQNKNKINGVVYLDNGEIKNYDLEAINTRYTNIEYTDERCFEWGIFDQSASIFQYYDYINNDSSNDVCPRDVVIPSYYNGKVVTIIGSRSFSEKQLTSVLIPIGVKIIAPAAFEKNQLTSVILPSSVNIIGDCVFEYNELNSIVIPDSVTEIGSEAFNYNKLKYVEIGTKNSLITSIGGDAFANGSDDDYGPNEISKIRIHLPVNGVNLSQSGLYSNVQVEWNE